MNQRTIKFRIWDGGQYQHPETIANPCEAENRHRIVEQFTGLLDKNGKEIYGGDIFKSGNGRLWLIKYGDWNFWDGKQLCPMYGWYAWGVEREGKTAHAELPLRSDSMNTTEVIGNIHENPELLKA